jgi:hypothetical protein
MSIRVIDPTKTSAYTGSVIVDRSIAVCQVLAVVTLGGEKMELFFASFPSVYDTISDHQVLWTRDFTSHQESPVMDRRDDD